MLSAFAFAMDYLGRETKGIEEFGRSEVWSKAARLLERNRPSRFEEVVSNAKAINWLSHVVRDQGFAHGLPAGNRSYPERQWLSRVELDKSIALITSRYAKLGAKRMFSLLSPSDALYCWVQLGDPEIAKQHIAEAMEDDLSFLSGLESMRSWQNSSATGVTHPLRDEVVAQFLDADESFARLKALSIGGQKLAVRKKASALLAAWERRKGPREFVSDDEQDN
jgi:hypothetical protein